MAKHIILTVPQGYGKKLSGSLSPFFGAPIIGFKDTKSLLHQFVYHSDHHSFIVDECPSKEAILEVIKSLNQLGWEKVRVVFVTNVEMDDSGIEDWHRVEVVSFHQQA